MLHTCKWLPKPAIKLLNGANVSSVAIAGDSALVAFEKTNLLHSLSAWTLPYSTAGSKAGDSKRLASSHVRLTTTVQIILCRITTISKYL